MQKLNRTGQWLWRDGELSISRYYELTKEEKIEHINFLLSLKDNELSTNDEYILNQYTFNIKNNKFLEL
jgi:hypothetical protein